MSAVDDTGEHEVHSASNTASVDVVGGSDIVPTPQGGHVSDGMAVGVNPRGSPRQAPASEADERRHTELDVNVSSVPKGLLSSDTEDSDSRYRRRVKSNLSRRLTVRKQSGQAVDNKAPPTPDQANSAASAVSQEMPNLSQLLALAQQLQGSASLPEGTIDKSVSSKKRKRQLTVSSSESDSDDSGSESDPFADKKRRVVLDSDQEAYTEKVFRDWLSNKETEKFLDKCFPRKKGVTVPRVHDDWMVNLLDKSSKQKVEAEDSKFIRLSKKVHMITGPVFKLWSLAEDRDDKEMVKFAKKSVLAVGQLQLALNHERRMLSYGELCRDHKRAKEHLKEASSSFGKVAKRAEKPALFGDKFKRAVIDRGTLTKQLREAKAQFERKPKGQFQPKAPQARSGPPTYASPLQRVQNPVPQQSYQSQPFQRDPSKKSSGRGRGSRYVSISSQGSGSGVHGSNNRCTLCSGGRVKKRTNKRVTFTNTAGGIPVHGKSSRVSASWVTGLSGPRPGRGAGKLVCPELGENCARSLGFKCGTDGLSARVDRETVSVSNTPPTNFQSGNELFGGYRGSGDDVERDYRGGCARAWPIHQQHLLGQQEGRRVLTCDKSEAVGSPGPLRTLSDGRSGDSAELCGCRRVSHQVRSEGCIFHSADSSGGQEIPSLQMGRETVPVSSPPVRALIGTSGIHSGVEGSNGILAKTGAKECGLPRRFLPGQSTCSGPDEDVDNSLVPFQAGIRGQLEKVLDTSVSKGGVPGLHSGHHQFSSGAPSTQSGQDHGLLYGAVGAGTVLREDTGIPDREASERVHSNLTCSPSFSPHADGQHQGSSQTTAKLCCKSGVAGGCVGRVEMVVEESSDVEWKVIPQSRSASGCCDNIRCESPRLGGRVPGSSDSGALVTTRDGSAYQCARVAGRRVGFEILQGFVARGSCPAQAGQHDSCLTDCEDGLSPVKKMFDSNPRDLGVCSVFREHGYCSAPPGQGQRDSRFSEPCIQGQQQLEAVPGNLSGSSETVSVVKSRPVRGSTQPSASAILELETGPSCGGCGRSDNGLEGNGGLRLPTFPVDPTDPKESAKRGCNLPTRSTGVVPAAMVSGLTGNVIRKTSVASDIGVPPHSTRRFSSSHVREPETHISRVGGFRGPGKSAELSAKAKELVAKARSSGTTRAYQSGWSKFRGWCDQQQVDPVSCPVEVIVNFLAEQQHLVLFGTLAGYRTAISFFHQRVNGVPVGKHPLVAELMKGAFRDNPPVPRYTETWDVSMVLAYLQELGPNAGLNQKELTLKLAMLLALVSRARGHELHAINPEAISWHEDKVVCHILGMTKTKTMSRPQKVFELLRFKESNNIDPVQCLKSYLNMTANQRETKVQKSHLFLSFVPPHHVVKTCSIARWLRLIMQEAGIDMSKFKAHSIRSAAVSKVPLAGMSVNEIAKLGDWSNASTFYRFYKKDVQSNSSESLVQKSILGLS